MASIESNGLGDEDDSEANEQTLSTHDAPDMARDQRTPHNAVETNRPVCRLFTLPPEIRAIIFDFACAEKPEIMLPGPLPTGMASLMRVLKDRHQRSEVADAVWQDCSIRWSGSLKSKTWQRFKKTAIPAIRHLIIEFELSDKTWFDLDSEIRQTLAWMWQRSKRGNRVRYPWHLKLLRLHGVRHNGSSRLSDGESKWFFSYMSEDSSLDCIHWSEDFSLKRLTNCGITVSVHCGWSGHFHRW